MEKSSHLDFIEKASQLPEGLVVITGPDREKNTGLVRLTEEAIANRAGPVYRVGGETPAADSRIRHFQTYHQMYEPNGRIPGSLEEEVDQWQEWDNKFRWQVSSHEPAAIIIEDLDMVSGGFAYKAIKNALNGTTVVVSVRADSFQDALECIHDSSGQDDGRLLSAALEMVLIQSSVIDPVTGQNSFSISSLELNDESRANIASWEN